MTLVSRALKTLFVASLAVAAAHLILSDTLGLGFSAQASATLGSPQGYSTDQVFTTAIVNTALVMPLVLWAGLRIAGERRVGIPVLVGTVAWIVTVWHDIDRIDDAPGALLPLSSLALVVGAAAVASLVPRGTRAGARAGARAGTQADTRAVTQAGARPGVPAGAQAGAQPGADADAGTGAEAGGAEVTPRRTAPPSPHAPAA